MTVMEKAIEAIGAVFGDTSVDRDTTKERMGELRGLIDENLADLEGD